MIVIQISEDGEEDEDLQEEGVEDEGVVQEAAEDEEETSTATTSSSNRAGDKPRSSKSKEGNLVPLARVRHRKMQQLSRLIPVIQVRRQTSELLRPD
jgi:hypothetical protein